MLSLNHTIWFIERLLRWAAAYLSWPWLHCSSNNRWFVRMEIFDCRRAHAGGFRYFSLRKKKQHKKKSWTEHVLFGFLAKSDFKVSPGGHHKTCQRFLLHSLTLAYAFRAVWYSARALQPISYISHGVLIFFFCYFFVAVVLLLLLLVVTMVVVLPVHTSATPNTYTLSEKIPKPHRI